MKNNTEEFYNTYMAAHAAGENINQFAARLGIKVGSASARLSALRSDLRGQGLTDEQVDAIVPSLTRVSSTTTKSTFITQLAAKAKLECSD